MAVDGGGWGTWLRVWSCHSFDFSTKASHHVISDQNCLERLSISHIKLPNGCLIDFELISYKQYHGKLLSNGKSPI